MVLVHTSRNLSHSRLWLSPFPSWRLNSHCEVNCFLSTSFLLPYKCKQLSQPNLLNKFQLLFIRLYRYLSTTVEGPLSPFPGSPPLSTHTSWVPWPSKVTPPPQPFSSAPTNFGPLWTRPRNVQTLQTTDWNIVRQGDDGRVGEETKVDKIKTQHMYHLSQDPPFSTQ